MTEKTEKKPFRSKNTFKKPFAKKDGAKPFKKDFKKKVPEVDIEFLKSLFAAAVKDQEWFQDFTLTFENSQYTNPETGEVKKLDTVLMTVTNNKTDDMKGSISRVYKIFKHGNQDEISTKGLKWLRNQPRIIRGMFRDYEAIDAAQPKNDRLFKDTFHSLGLRFKGNGQGAMNRK